MLQWGHGIAAVESGQQRHGAEPANARFNGATALLPWNLLAARATDLNFSASMGPRHCCRGIHTPVRSFGLVLLRLQWGHGIAAVESMVESGSVPCACQLQWGHGIAAVESIFIALKG